MNVGLNVKDMTLGHELFHALYNRVDGPAPAIGAQFFTFNTLPPAAYVKSVYSKLPDSRIYQRIHPFSIDWFTATRRVRYFRPDSFGNPVEGFTPMELTPSTGNTLVKPY